MSASAKSPVPAPTAQRREATHPPQAEVAQSATGTGLRPTHPPQAEVAQSATGTG